MICPIFNPSAKSSGQAVSAPMQNSIKPDPAKSLVKRACFQLVLGLRVAVPRKQKAYKSSGEGRYKKRKATRERERERDIEIDIQIER